MMMTREERLKYLRALRDYIDAPLGEGVEPRDPREIIPRKPLVIPTPIRSDGGVNDQAAYLMAQAMKNKPAATTRKKVEVSDKAASLMAEAVKSLLQS